MTSPIALIRGRGPARRGAILGLAALLAACSTYQPFDTTAYLRESFAQRLPPELEGRVAIPFALDEDHRAAVEQLIVRTGIERDRAALIESFIFSTLRLRYALTPTRNADATFAQREGNCLSFVNLFVGIGRHVGMNPFYVEVEDYQRWNYKDGVVLSRGHIVAGMRIDGDLSTFDFLPYRPKAYRSFKPIDDLTATAHFYNNLGAEALMQDDAEAALPHLEIAHALAPDFEKALNNLGVAYTRLGRPDEAVALYDRGLALYPASVPLLNNLARIYQERGREKEAELLLARLDEVNETNPYFFIYRGEVALAGGDVEAALEHMRHALRIDSENPEVHVGLAKVFLARADLERAGFHIDRALRLDATHDEARRYAAMLAARGVDGGGE